VSLIHHAVGMVIGDIPDLDMNAVQQSIHVLTPLKKG